MTDRRPRAPISKRLRFEIYKRDHFTCTYCGRTPPTVVLELDHLVAHADGGADDATNLVTACEDCNAGKSNVPLGEVMPHIGADKVAEMQERVEQMRAYREWRTEFDAELRRDLPEVWQAWIDAFDGYLDGETYRCKVDFPPEQAVLGYLTELTIDEIRQAVRAAERKYRNSDLARRDVARYFFGVMRNMVRRNEEARQLISITWPELVEALPELEAVRADVAGFNPLDAWNYCGDHTWQSGWNVRLEDGTRHPIAAPSARVEGLVGPKSENARDPVLGSYFARDLALRTIKAALPPCGQTCTCGRLKRPPREADYPRCAQCGQVTAPVDGRESCQPRSWLWEGRELEPIRFGWEASIQRCEIATNWGRYKLLDQPKTFEPAARCPGCHTPAGGFHHPTAATRPAGSVATRTPAVPRAGTARGRWTCRRSRPWPGCARCG